MRKCLRASVLNRRGTSQVMHHREGSHHRAMMRVWKCRLRDHLIEATSASFAAHNTPVFSQMDGGVGFSVGIWNALHSKISRITMTKI